MPDRTLRLALVVLCAAVTLAWVSSAQAAGVVNISTCQTLNIPNTTYKLTADLTSCGTCLIVADDKITIDLQGHSITSVCGQFGAAIGDMRVARSLTVVKNGSVVGFTVGVDLGWSPRSSVLGVTATGNVYGILVTAGGLVKSSVARDNTYIGIYGTGERTQIQQSDASNNGNGGIIAQGDNCLVTMNTANDNGNTPIFGTPMPGGIYVPGFAKCTVSYNTANNNAVAGIYAGTYGAPGNLVTQNTAMGNLVADFAVECPSTVTFNTSSGNPNSYIFGTPPPCQTSNNQ